MLQAKKQNMKQKTLPISGYNNVNMLWGDFDVV